MKVAYINPFVSAVTRVLSQEAGVTVRRGNINMTAESVTSEDITVIIGVVGQVHGVVMYSISERMAKSIVSKMIDQEVPVFDAMAESAIAELGNVITGVASADLEQAGFKCRLAPPTIIMGRGVYISTVLIQRLVIPIETELGTLYISVALSEAPGHVDIDGTDA